MVIQFLLYLVFTIPANGIELISIRSVVLSIFDFGIVTVIIRAFVECPQAS